MRASTMIRPRRLVEAHRPTAAADGTPGVCWCGLPLGLLNARHRPDEDQIERDAMAALLAQRVERARYGDTD